MERYAINKTRKKLHTQSCKYAASAFETSENISLSQLLDAYSKTLKCCGRCLKKDSFAQELVTQHNDKFVWHQKNKTKRRTDYET